MYYSRPASANGHGHGHSHGHGQPRGLLGMNPSMATPGLPFAGLQGQSTADVPVQYGPNEPAVRYDYDYRAGVWKRTETTVSVSNQPCQAGSLRLIFRLKDFTLPEGKQDCVAKIAKDRKETRQSYFTDVEMQAVAKRFAEEFNKRSPPKPIDFVVPWVVEFKNRPAPNGQGRLVMGVEPLLRGAYYKHTNNFGWVSNDDRNTPQAFSHFTYAHSGGQLLVCDIQGVGDVYTDPQIHSRAAPGRYGQADLGVQGINKFFSTHRCNAICQFLQLPVVSAVKSRQLPQGVTPCPVLPTIRLGEARTA